MAMQPMEYDELDGMKTKWFSQSSVKKISDGSTVYALENGGLYYFAHGISNINEAYAAFVFGFGYYSLVNNVNDANIIFKAGAAASDLRVHPITGILFYKTT